MYINGEWITLQEQIEVNNPATKEIFATVPKGGVTEQESKPLMLHMKLLNHGLS